MIELFKYIFCGWIIIRSSSRLSIYTSILFHYVHSIFEQMDKVQSTDKVQSDMEAKKQKMKAETQEKGQKYNRRKIGKHKREAQEVGYAVKGYWIKEKKKVKVNGVEKEVIVIKDLVFSPNVSLSKDQNATKDTWGFIRFQLH